MKYARIYAPRRSSVFGAVRLPAQELTGLAGKVRKTHAAALANVTQALNQKGAAIASDEGVFEFKKIA